ncbi:MAG: hypothetical protein L0332_13760 [Chloroflexi bacterium]|nr:hypothetical protein [Chloroflexota bacterium]MCI0580614.1 hypothetical protein [Chloroflexota bacterium]MCI0649722.1 hypothetical protein [Chloroflexota bacterium]MCI0727770.1 hypothetical protein [Chloroflexota bacterium]
MQRRGLYDRKGELFAYLVGDTLYTLEDEVTGRLEGDFVVDTAGNRVWRVYGDGVYSLEGFEPIGYFGSRAPEDV